jgi:H+/Cl- antiporter ClcA
MKFGCLFSFLSVITVLLAWMLVGLFIDYPDAQSAERTGYALGQYVTSFLIYVVAPLGFVIGFLYQKRKKKPPENGIDQHS